MTEYYSPENSLEREKVISSLLGEDILKGSSLSRLKNVSFLGALNVAASVPDNLNFNRFDHSISVAYLTWRFCKNLGIREDIATIAILAALIHDVTHPPFSHSTEIYLHTRAGSGQKHTSILTVQKIIKVIKEGYKTFPLFLQNEEPEKLGRKIWVLLKEKKGRKRLHPYLENIFETPFCPDTFDGINRAWYALTKKGANKRSDVKRLGPVEVIDPTSLIDFISTKTPFPFIFRSPYPPSRANLIFRFHNQMRMLYNDVIYSDWQTATMVFFARAVDIAYSGASRFDMNQTDVDVLIKITENPSSHKLYKLLIEGKDIYALSRENPSLFASAMEHYRKSNNQKNVNKAIESMVANELGVDNKSVFYYKYRPLIWLSSNINFNTLKTDEQLWRLSWDDTEGEPSPEFKQEIYYTPLF